MYRYTLRVYAVCIVAGMSIGQTFLGLLEATPRHGYDLKRLYDERFGHARPLALRAGLRHPVPAAAQRPGRGGRRGARRAARNASGTRSPRPGSPTWRTGSPEPEKPEPYLQTTLYTKVVLALLTGRPAADVLDIQRAEHLRLMRELTRRKRDGDLADQLICDHALFHLEADLRWLELTAARLDELAGDGARRDAADPLLLAEDLHQVVRPDPGARRRGPAVHPGEVRGRHGPVRLRQVDAAALPRRHRPARLRPGPLRRPRPRRPDRRASAARCAASEFGFVFQFGQLVPELTCLENVALPLRLGGSAGARPSGGPPSGWTGWRSPRWPASGPARSRAGRGSGSRSPARWSPGHGWSSPTSRPARSTRSTASG